MKKNDPLEKLRGLLKKSNLNIALMCTKVSQTGDVKLLKEVLRHVEKQYYISQIKYIESVEAHYNSLKAQEENNS